MGARVPRLTEAGQARRRQAETCDSRARAGAEPVAVIGLACRFPGAADVNAFWRLLCEGADAIRDAPPGRREADVFASASPTPYPDKFRRGGFLEQVDQFDPLFFGISPREAVQMDPQQRLALELAWEALEDAGLPARSLKGSEAGVFWGCMWNDYARLLSGRLPHISQHTALGQDSSIIAARISYALGLRGPSMVVNTASSSSLVAVHLACQSLRLGESAIAVAGGVNLLLAPESTLSMARLGALSPSGRSRPFAEGADGYVRAEGGGAVVLKPLARALQDDDNVYCVIRGSAVNNDGCSNGLAAPNPQAQQAVLRRAYELAGAATAEVQFVETHGSGTPLGDAVEAEALGAVLGGGRDRPLPIGSVKSNLGHMEAAAGIGGLIKVAISISRGAVPPTINCERPSRHIPFDDLRLKVQTTLSPWPDGDRPALAGVSSFGFGGTNCHVVLGGLHAPRGREPASPDARGGRTRAGARPLKEADANRAELFLLSAHTPLALRELGQATASLVAESADVSLHDLCYTSAVRRSHHDHRTAFVCRSKDELIGHLRRLSQTGARADTPHTPQGGAPDDERAARLAAVGALYVRGLPVDMGALHPQGGRCVRLPPYAWQRQRYWLDEETLTGADLDLTPGPSAGRPARRPASDGKAEPRPAGEPCAPAPRVCHRPDSVGPLREAIRAAGAAERQLMAEQYLREQVSELLMLPPPRLDFDSPLLRLGFDSLMAVELEARLDADLGIEVPLDTLFQDMTVARLAALMLRRLAAESMNGPCGGRHAETGDGVEWEVFTI